MTIVLRTHGGLGNQLFQIAYARLLARVTQSDCVEIHDARYEHGFQRSSEISNSGAPSGLQRFISGLRLPKILSKTGFHATESVHILGDIYLDGYFQNAEDFESFSRNSIGAEIATLRSELRVQPQTTSDMRTLYHIRLGDFFDNSEAAQEHAIQRVEQLRENSTIITNQEDIFSNDRVRQHLRAKRCQLHGTGEYSPEDVIRLMSTFGEIVTNNSTLALWASVLGHCRTSLDDSRLSTVHRLLFDAANPSPSGASSPAFESL